MDSELWLSRIGDQQWAAAVEDGRIVELHHGFPASRAVSRGEIYLAKVQRVAPGLGASFVQLAAGREAYIEEDGLEPGQPIIVQVRREAHEGKRPRVSRALELVSSRLTLRPHGDGVAVARRIRDAAERERLTRWAREAGSGRLVLRNAASGSSEDQLAADLATLQARYAEITDRASESRPPCQLAAAPGLAERLVTDYAARGLRRVLVENDADAQEVERANAAVPLERYAGRGAMVRDLGIWDACQAAREPQVRLESGASLIIERTAALWAVDVNAGAARSSGDRRHTTAAINAEAAAEAACQLRLRDVAGTILVDFLSPDTEDDRDRLTELFRTRLRSDRRYLRVTGWTGLGLCELARRREGPSLLERLGPPSQPTEAAREAAERLRTA